MFQSHQSYSKNCNLGSRETNLIVRLVQDLGPENGFYGAKITGGGSGGTVAIMMQKGNEQIHNIVSKYYNETGIEPQLFIGSSQGALYSSIQKTIFD